jgi:hypothetical protein
MIVENMIGTSYETETGLKFKVVQAEDYPTAKIGKQFKKILALKAGYLVAISYRGTLIPNITLDEGVARLTSVEVEGKVLSRPNAISQAIGIKVPMTAYELRKVE